MQGNDHPMKPDVGFYSRFVRVGGKRGRKCRFIREVGKIPGGTMVVEIEIPSPSQFGAYKMLVIDSEVQRGYYERQEMIRNQAVFQRDFSFRTRVARAEAFIESSGGSAVLPAVAEELGVGILTAWEAVCGAGLVASDRVFNTGEVAPGGYYIKSKRNLYVFSKQ